MFLDYGMRSQARTLLYYVDTWVLYTDWPGVRIVVVWLLRQLIALLRFGIF